MKKVIFVRHGKSSWDEPHLEDHERPLKKRGIEDAKLVAHKILEKGFIPELICSSDAERTKQTALLFKEILEIETIELYRELYHADEHSIIRFLSKLSDDMDSVMLFGHNPTFTGLINYFSEQWIANVPTSGAFRIDFKINNWVEISDFNGSLKNYWFPKMLK